MKFNAECGMIIACVVSLFSSIGSAAADEAYIYSYADTEGWGIQYLVDSEMDVRLVRVAIFQGHGFYPEPNDDGPWGPIGPWVKPEEVERVYGKFSNVVGYKPNPEDEDDPWGPLGPLLEMQRDFVALGAFNSAAFIPDPDADVCPWPWPWPGPGPQPWKADDFLTFDVETELGTHGTEIVWQVSLERILSFHAGPEPQPWDPDPVSWKELLVVVAFR